MLPFLVVAACAAGPAPSDIRPTDLRCEYRVDPLGIGAPTPRLGWTLRPGSPLVRGAIQRAYQIVASASRERLLAGQSDLWDTGRIESDETLHVPWAGKMLTSWQQVWWRVRAWDGHGRPCEWSAPASFTMGAAAADWSARWITHAEAPSPASRAHNGYHTAESHAADEAKWVTVDLGKSVSIDGVRLFPARPFDWKEDAPGFLFPLRYAIEGAETEAGPFRLLADRTASDSPNPGSQPVLIRFPAASVRYVRLRINRLREREPGVFAAALAELQVLEGDRNAALGAHVTAADSIENGAWAAANLTNGDTLSHPAAGGDAHPPILFRRALEVNGAPRRALVCVSALGAYELRVNGRRVGEQILAPEWTDYRKRVQYQMHDITALLRPGRNVIAAIVGDGWYAGRIGLFPGRAHYGDRPALRLQARIETTSSRSLRLETDARWEASRSGPIRSSDILDGEVYDARLDPIGWDRVDGPRGDFTRAVVIEPAVGAMVAQANEPIRVIEELKPVALTQPRPGVYVYDLGQNMVGRARLALHVPTGTALTLRHAEMLNDDGTIYTTNLRGAPQVDRYIAAGQSTETAETHFTYHGFRYVEVTGLPAPPRITDLVGRVFCSSSPEVGRFDSSSKLITRLMRNILWTQRANLMSTPTDCPQRDERLGWMGDIQSFAQTACFNMDMAGFFTKWLQDVWDAQADDGRFPDFAPNPGNSNVSFSGVPAWGDAGVVVPWRAYTNYADSRILERAYPPARRWIEYIQTRNPDLIWRNGRNADYNDWLNGDTLIAQGWPRTGGAVPNDLFATAFFAHSTDLTARMATVLGHEAEARDLRALFDRIRAAFCAAFLRADGSLTGDTQAGYALALHFNLLPAAARAEAARRMAAGIAAYHGHISTGIQSTHRMMLELSRAGMDDIAWDLVNRTTFPSWGFMIENGATTIWERWDGYVKGRGFQDPGMNSFNHWALGSVGEWVWRVAAGIEPDEAHPGWSRFTIHPRPGGGMTWARAEFRSPRGPIISAWRIERGALTLDVTVPPNSVATVTVPTADPASVTESGRPANAAPGVSRAAEVAGGLQMEIGSGVYRFTAKQ